MPPPRSKRAISDLTRSRALGLAHKQPRPKQSANAPAVSPTSHASQTPLPPTLPGDAHWLRVMATKESQWRLLNLLALHEMSARETAACAQLDALANRLAVLREHAAALEETVRICTAIRQKQHFDRLARPNLQRLCTALGNVEGRYRKACDALVENAHVVELTGAAVGCQAALAHELCRFREVARRFADTAKNAGVDELVQLCDALEELATVVGDDEAPAVGCAAEAVLECAREAERDKCRRIADGVNNRVGRKFEPEPSFVD